MLPVLFVSMNRVFNMAYSLPDLEPRVERAWPLTVSRKRLLPHVGARVASRRSGRPHGALG
jgi:hypothetical protein